MQEQRVALLIIDMQNDFVMSSGSACVAGARKTIPTISKVLEDFRKRDWPVIHIFREHREDGIDIESCRKKQFLEGKKFCLPGSKGAEIVKELRPAPKEICIVKKRFSAFMNTDLDLILRRLDIGNLLVCGTQYPYCIRCTVFDGLALGYGMYVLTDGTSAQIEEIAKANILDMQNIGVVCKPYTEIKEIIF